MTEIYCVGMEIDLAQKRLQSPSGAQRLQMGIVLQWTRALTLLHPNWIETFPNTYKGRRAFSSGGVRS